MQPQGLTRWSCNDRIVVYSQALFGDARFATPRQYMESLIDLDRCGREREIRDSLTRAAASNRRPARVEEIPIQRIVLTKIFHLHSYMRRCPRLYAKYVKMMGNEIRYCHQEQSTPNFAKTHLHASRKTGRHLGGRAVRPRSFQSGRGWRLLVPCRRGSIRAHGVDAGCQASGYLSGQDSTRPRASSC